MTDFYFAFFPLLMPPICITLYSYMLKVPFELLRILTICYDEQYVIEYLNFSTLLKKLSEPLYWNQLNLTFFKHEKLEG